MAAVAFNAQRHLSLPPLQHSLFIPLFRKRTSITMRPFFFRAVASSPSVAPPLPSVVESCRESQQPSGTAWQPFCKKKVVMRVGYVGSNYRGLQMQKDEHSLSTVEKELEVAIYKAGGILDSNFGNLHKIAWCRSSRTDKGVHSLATTISMKMEIPESAWKGDPFGIHLASHINVHLPEDIRIFSILPSKRSFDPRRECSIRKYSYLLPAEIIGIRSTFSPPDVEDHINDFDQILNGFEGEHPFHNYTIRAKYRKKLNVKKTRKDIRLSLEKKSSDAISTSETEESDNDDEDELSLDDAGEMDRDGANLRGQFHEQVQDHRQNSSRDRQTDVAVRARWLYEPDENDRISSSHFRNIIRCSCGPLESLNGINYVVLSIWVSAASDPQNGGDSYLRKTRLAPKRYHHSFAG
ncbi:hypothetical protein MLD38_040621 [Melastoma candidum]|nr:hypothetical protein MLD38_040621 [Melastoma candidum]